MMRVHCFVSCVCELLKQGPGFDERPFYFGVWDADFFVTKEYALAYHAEHADHSFFRTWYERLYGVPIRQWYDDALPKELNVERLLDLLETRPAHRSVMVMLDLFHLPERENKFNQNPFPHYVMLEATRSPEQWLMKDPDFRWEGELPRARILEAVRQPSVAGGYYLDAVGVRAPTDEAVKGCFEACIKAGNPLTEALQTIVQAHLAGATAAGLGGLSLALRELPVLALRKYAYEHGFAFFWRALSLDPEAFASWCAEIDALVKGYTLVQYRAMKLATTKRKELAEELLELLTQQNALELRIKRGLTDAFEAWCAHLGAGPGRALLMDGRVNP